MAKRKLKSKFKFFFAFLIILIIGYIGLRHVNQDTNFNLDNINKITGKKETWPKVNKISLLATGDSLIHNAVYMDAYDKASNTFDFNHQLSMVKDIVQKYDLAYYNQETVFGGKRTERFSGDPAQIDGYCSYPYFNTPSEYGDAMVNSGFNLISLASNHSTDCTWASESCINNAYQYWKNKNVYFDGFNNDETEENKYNIGEINGIKFGFLNYTNTLNGLDRFVNDASYLIDMYDEEKVKNEVEELKKKVDVIIVAMHWHKSSAEYSTTPTQANKDIALYLSDLGVDIILGTYSHCLQPFDIIGDNNTVVFYSLGNFISNQGDIVSSVGYKGIVGVLATMDIVKTEYENGTVDIEVKNIGADLTYTYNNNHHNYLVIPFSKMTSEYNKNYLDIYEDYKEILTSLNNNISIVPVNE